MTPKHDSDIFVELKLWNETYAICIAMQNNKNIYHLDSSSKS